MTFYLSRYVRDDVSFEQFLDGLNQYLSYSMRDPANNISELDKSIESMLNNKLFSPQRPSLGLFYHAPKVVKKILNSYHLIKLLFYHRIMQKKHEWPLIYLSMISKHLIQIHQQDKLPSIYRKFNEIDLNRGLLCVSTCDYFFMSFISYPIIIGPEKQKILNQLYSTQRYQDAKKNADKKLPKPLEKFMYTVLPPKVSKYFNIQDPDDEFKNFKIPTNPFEFVNKYYGEIYDFYLNLYLPQIPYSRHPSQQQQSGQFSSSAFDFKEYGIKFIEIVGELWFGQSFQNRPIGDRIHTLPLMQDLLFRIMQKQCKYQYQYAQNYGSGSYGRRTEYGSQSMGTFDTSTHSTELMSSRFESDINDRLYGLGKIPKHSCICPELQSLLKYLYTFFRESFEHFPLDFIAHLRIVIEMWLYILSPWMIGWKFNNKDNNIRIVKESERMRLIQEMHEMTNNKTGIFQSLYNKITGAKSGLNTGFTEQTAFANDVLFKQNQNFQKWNDDRERELKFNNTQFVTAQDMVVYELDGMDQSFDIKVWRQYIIEMLPFYTTLINYFIDALLKYDFNHPLKQLCVLKVLHIYKNEQILNLLQQTENILFNPYHNNNLNQNNNQMMNTFDQLNSNNYINNSEPMYILNIIQEITYKPLLNHYRCLPFEIYPNDPTNQQLLYQQWQQSQWINIGQVIKSKQMTMLKAQQLYIKCCKTMTRLCPATNTNNNPERKDEEEMNQNQNINDDQEQKYPENNNQQNKSQNKQQTQTQNTEKPNWQAIMSGIVQILRIIWTLLTNFLAMIGSKKQSMTQKLQQNTQRATTTAYTRYGSKINYFAEGQDNVKIIRYIIGEMEELFNINGQQQQDLMNESIMYEPTQSMSPAMTDRKRRSFESERQSQRHTNHINRKGQMIWNRPCGEWESYYSLIFWRFLYNQLISRNKFIDALYCDYLAQYHRLLLTDKRFLTWAFLLFGSYLFMPFGVFVFILMVFIGVIILSLKI